VKINTLALEIATLLLKQIQETKKTRHKIDFLFKEQWYIRNDHIQSDRFQIDQHIRY
jgi:hypothetical protein